jgi:hypothetical protein
MRNIDACLYVRPSDRTTLERLVELDILGPGAPSNLGSESTPVSDS